MKCIGTHDSEVEAVSNLELERFWQLMNVKEAPQVIADLLLKLGPLIESEQKFKNIASYT